MEKKHPAHIYFILTAKGHGAQLHGFWKNVTGQGIELSEACFENDDWTMDPDLRLNGQGLKVCKACFSGDETTLKAFWIKKTMEYRKAAKQQASEIVSTGNLTDQVKKELDALKEQLNHIDETITDQEMCKELKEDLTVNFKKRMAKLYGVESED
jgi:hypothetical protein